MNDIECLFANIAAICFVLFNLKFSSHLELKFLNGKYIIFNQDVHLRKSITASLVTFTLISNYSVFKSDATKKEKFGLMQKMDVLFDVTYDSRCLNRNPENPSLPQKNTIKRLPLDQYAFDTLHLFYFQQN